MERLRSDDFRKALEFLRGLYAIRDLAAFSRHVVSGLPAVIGSDITSYNEVNVRQGRNVSVHSPPDVLAFPGNVQLFERHLHEHPLVRWYADGHDGEVLTISDFLSRGQFHRLGLYADFYRRLRVEHQMAVALPAPTSLVIGIALNRQAPDFSGRDRVLLNLLRPHLIQAYRNAEALTEAGRDSGALVRGLETRHLGVLFVTPAGRVRLMTPLARQWLGEYFDPAPRRPDDLPETLQRWIQQNERRLATWEEVPPPRQPLVIEREGKRLVVRLLSDEGQISVLLEEQRIRVEPASLVGLGLTRREAEVLAWLAEGKTNAEIGTILGAKPATVKKHLERIYQKLGVETRTAAAKLVLTVVLGSG